ncbi:MAG: DUF4340 domain-containing protein [Acidobacteriota bacterium]
MSLVSGGETLRLERRGDGEVFWLTAPLEDRADPQSVTGLLNGLTALKASRFLDADADGAALGLDPAPNVVAVELAGGDDPWRLELGELAPGDGDDPDAPERFARAGGQTVALDTAGFRDPFELGVEEWRSRAWSSTQVFRVEGARFELGAAAVDIRRDSGDWIKGTEGGEDIRIDYVAASDALYPLTEIRAVDLISRAEAAEAGYDLDAPALTVTLTGSEDAQERLQLFTAGAPGGPAAATVDGRDVVLQIAPGDAATVLEKVAALRDAPPYVEPAGD